MEETSAMKILSLFFLFIGAICVAEETCEKGEKVKLTQKLSMVCANNTWFPAENIGKQSRMNPGAPPCLDSWTKAQCSEEKQNCNQYTVKGKEMDRVCPGTCGSCDGCRCQDSSQWHKYCQFWANHCNNPGILGTWMGANCKKTCNKCRCNCCSYKGKKHSLGERIPLPENCGELVCEEGLHADASPLLPNAATHKVSHPEDLTLVFRANFSGHKCCILPADAEDGHMTLNNGTMVKEGWSGTLNISGVLVTATCCHGIICVPLQGTTQIPITTPTTTPTTTTPTTTTPTTTTPIQTTRTTQIPITTPTTTAGCPSGWSEFQSKCYRAFPANRTWPEAQTDCVNNGADLASIANAAVNNFVANLTSQFDNYPFYPFLGGYEPTANTWAWIDGSTWSYANWDFGNPNGGEGCLVLYPYSGLWHDWPCVQYKKPYVCSKHI